MYQLDRLLIALDLTEMDKVLIEYAAKFAKKVGSQKVYFLHIAKDFEIPAEITQKYPDLVAPKDESIMALMQEEVDKYWDSSSDIEHVIEVKEGNPFDELLKFVDNKSIDIVVMGRKESLKGSGVLPDKVSSLIHSSVLIVPEESKFELNRIVVPLDFSRHSKLAVEHGLQLKEVTKAELQFVHVYTVPSGYHKVGKSYDEFAAIMERHAENDYKLFIDELEIKNTDDLKCDFILDGDSNPSDKIFAYSEAKEASLMIMGSKGRTGLASILLGSVTSKVISYDTKIPLLVVKEREENMGFLKALLKI